MRSAGKAHSDNGYRYGGLKYLPDLQAQISTSRRKDYSHKNTPSDRPGRNFSVLLIGLHNWFILLAGLQFSKCIIRQSGFFFHNIYN